MEINDKQLIKNYLSGDDDKLKILIDRHLKAIYNFVFRFCNNKQDAEDITQEVFLKMWKNIKKYDEHQNFNTWLFTIAKNTAFDWLRKKRNLVFSDFDTPEGKNLLTETITDTTPNPEELIIKTENATLLNNLVNQLPTFYQTILLLRYTDEFTFDEIAKILNKPLNTVKSQHRRALLLLQNLADKLNLSK